MNEIKDFEKKVLIAEDDQFLAECWRSSSLAGDTKEPSVTSDTEAPLAPLRRDAPRLAELDWMMPGLEGVALQRERCRQVRGGGSFAIVLLDVVVPSSDAINVLGLSERIRRAIESNPSIKNSSPP